MVWKDTFFAKRRKTTRNLSHDVQKYRPGFKLLHSRSLPVNHQFFFGHCKTAWPPCRTDRPHKTPHQAVGWGANLLSCSLFTLLMVNRSCQQDWYVSFMVIFSMHVGLPSGKSYFTFHPGVTERVSTGVMSHYRVTGLPRSDPCWRQYILSFPLFSSIPPGKCWDSIFEIR